MTKRDPYAVNPKHVDVEFRSDGWIPDPVEDQRFGAAFPDKLLIGGGKLTHAQFNAQCREIIEWKKQHNISGKNYVRPLNNQRPESSCVYNGAEAVWRGTRNRALGNEWEIKGSPMSGYIQQTRRRNSGSTMWGAMQHMTEHGILPETNKRNKPLFKHTFHQNAPFVQREKLPDGYETTARHLRVLEWVRIDDGYQYVSAVLKHGYFLLMGRSGHSMAVVDITWHNKSLHAVICDSYGTGRGDGGYVYDSWRTITRATGGAWAAVSVYLPHDPSKPAGRDGTGKRLTLAA